VKPKKYSEFKKDIAHTVGVHSNVVNDFITYYYTQAIIKNKSILGNLKKTTYIGMEKTHAVNDKLQKQEKAFKKLEEEIKNKQEFKKRKNEL